jgi:polyisoprenoid-binding protein YceI
MTIPAAAGTAPAAQPGEWAADLAACTVRFTVRNFALRSVTGQIPIVSAGVTIGPDGQPARVRAELDARGIDTGHQRRDNDLRGPRFLATGRWPAITFQASSIQASGAGWTIDGTLTVKDCHCPVRLNVSDPAIPPGDPVAPVSLRATARLDRRSAGVNAGPAFLIGHTISLSLAMRFRPPATIPGTSGGPPPGTKAQRGRDGREVAPEA